MSLQTILIAGIGIIVLALFIRLYHVIYIGMVRLLFGKYSSRYFATYRRYTGQNPYPYCIKDDFINYIAGFNKKQPNLNEFDSDSEIVFLDIPFNTKFRSVLKQSKKPFCINSNRLKQFDLKVLGYKDALFTVDMKKYFFFIDGTFFLGQLTFKNPNKESIRKIIGVISKKYLEGKTIETDRFIIHGRNETFLLCVFNGFHLTISYLSRENSEIAEKIDDYWGKSTNLNLGNHATFEQELLDKL